MEDLLKALRLGFLVCVRPGSVFSFLKISYLDPRHDFERSLLQLALLHQADWAGAVPESAPRPHFTFLQETYDDRTEAFLILVLRIYAEES